MQSLLTAPPRDWSSSNRRNDILNFAAAGLLLFYRCTGGISRANRHAKKISIQRDCPVHLPVISAGIMQNLQQMQTYLNRISSQSSDDWRLVAGDTNNYRLTDFGKL